jgi:hypothetical protein
MHRPSGDAHGLRCPCNIGLHCSRLCAARLNKQFIVIDVVSNCCPDLVPSRSKRPDTLMQDRNADRSTKFSCNARPDHTSGSIAVAESSDRHGRTCFNTGRQGKQPPCILLIDGITVAIKGKRRARCTSVPDVTVAGDNTETPDTAGDTLGDTVSPSASRLHQFSRIFNALSPHSKSPSAPRLLIDFDGLPRPCRPKVFSLFHLSTRLTLWVRIYVRPAGQQGQSLHKGGRIQRAYCVGA